MKEQQSFIPHIAIGPANDQDWIEEDFRRGCNGDVSLRRDDADIRPGRLEALNALAPTLIHELSQPLGATANYLNACSAHIRQRIEGLEEVFAMVARASRQNARATEIIRRMRDFAVSGKVASQAEDLRSIVDSALAAVPSMPTVEVLRAYHAAGVYVIADRVQIEQVFSNLFANAVEAMRDSRIRRLKISTSSTERETHIRIEDSGHGLAPEALERLFEPFFTSKSYGTGLGLPICQTIVDAHGGRLWAEQPVPGSGAVFNLTLPSRLAEG